ncbi:hypothetical protein SPF06_02390 [Sinomonas sp. JGH33]|uniref:SnoaL-like domain-containing protein n=1 Tax=Sinomonas terricola TaxID=3110330 RepID=A0ABU5T327_9MICC|nr:hypothetical protein [Sinomonas sp. JGH33]MEA5453561.1 hypothetical protein [Sinomonas sp. JGH33]
MAGRSLEGLCTALEHALALGDAKALRSLYLPTAVLVLVVGKARFEATPEDAAVDRARLGLPIGMTVRSITEMGGCGEIILDWSVSGVTSDGTVLDLAGDAALTCTQVAGDWYITSEQLRGYERAGISSASRIP